MALGKLFRKVYDVTNGGAMPTVGQTATLRIDRRAGLRLEKIMIHANVSVTFTTATASRNGLNGLFKECRLKVSDYAGTSRYAVKAPSATLVDLQRDREGKLGRYMQQSYGTTATHPATGTYDVIFPIHIKPAGQNEAIGSAYSLPLQDRIGKDLGVLGVADDPILELEVAPNISALGFSAGSITINSLKAHLHMRDQAPTSAYVASAFEYGESSTFTTTSETELPLASTGQLLFLSIEEFTASTARGFAQAANALWKFKHGRTDYQEWTTKMAQELQGYWQTEYPNGNTAAFAFDRNPVAFTVVDLLHDTTLGEAISGASTFDLYTENRGDNAKLVATSPVVGASVGIGTFKIFAPVSVLNGV